MINLFLRFNLIKFTLKGFCLRFPQVLFPLFFDQTHEDNASRFLRESRSSSSVLRSLALDHLLLDFIPFLCDPSVLV